MRCSLCRVENARARLPRPLRVPLFPYQASTYVEALPYLLFGLLTKTKSQCWYAEIVVLKIPLEPVEYTS